jgi:hypothetical protein
VKRYSYDYDDLDDEDRKLSTKLLLKIIEFSLSGKEGRDREIIGEV